MSTYAASWAGWLLILVLVALPAAGWAATVEGRNSGTVVAVDKAAGIIVVGDMGPVLKSGQSEITRRTVLITPSTEFARVKRSAGVGPGGWVGEYVETRLPAWEIKEGDFVTVAVTADKDRLTAVKITVADPAEP